jgi:hypothetical protein
MPTKDGFAQDHPLPLFLSNHTEQPGRPGIGKARGGAVISSRILRTGILVVTAAAIDFAILSVGNPVALFANVTASLVDSSALQPGTGQSTPTIQSTAGAEGLQLTARLAPTRDEIVAALKSQTEIRQPTTEASLTQFQAWAVAEEAGHEIAAPADTLLKQFEAWAAEEEARTQVGSVPPVEPAQPAQDVPSEAAPIVRAENQRMDQPVPKHRRVRPARAEIQPAQNTRAKVRRVQNARVQIRPAQDARAQDGTGQNAQAPSLLQSLGLRN